jgi:MoaA/NifB/PqqE/SkfB family radical SAM enzyme
MTESIILSEVVESNNLYNYLKSLYRSEYPDNYRIVVEYHKDTINNPDQPGEYLSLLVRLISELDISPYFVVIQTGYKMIVRDLSELARFYQDIDCITVESSAETFKSIRTSTDTFCVEPWVHLYFDPQGKITPCCIADSRYPLGEYRSGTVDFNSAEIIKLRQTLLNGFEAPQCSTCYLKEKSNQVSYRQTLNKKFAHHIKKDMPAVVDPFKLRQVDVRLSNLCNLTCRMCSGKFSNKIAHEDFQIWGTTEYLRDNNTVEDEQTIFEVIKNQIDHIETVYFAGGEPLINKTHYAILALLLDNNKSTTEITYNTNFSLLKFKQYDVLDYWKKFSNVTVGASIDLIGPAANYVRTGVEYLTLEQNYRLLISQCPDVRFEIHSTLSLYNAINLCDLQQHWINTMKLDPVSIKFNLLMHPDHLELTVLPTDIKQHVDRRVKMHIEYLATVGADQLIMDWKNALAVMHSKDNSHLLAKFFKINDARDQHRNHKFEDYFPEYCTLRDYLV